MTAITGNSKARGCGGSRTKGGIYFESNGVDGGLPLECFFVDPPIKVDLDELGISPIGTHLIEQNGVWNLLDVVGSEHYGDVADFIEEGRRLGFSRRSSLRRPEDYAKLTRESKHLFIHRRAFIENFEIFKGVQLMEAGLKCPRGKEEHNLRAEMCACLWYADVADGFVAFDEDKQFAAHEETVLRGYKELPCGDKYKCYQSKADLLDRQYHYAVFLSLPISRIVLVDPDGEFQEKLGLLKNAELPVEVLDE